MRNSNGDALSVKQSAERPDRSTTRECGTPAAPRSVGSAAHSLVLVPRSRHQIYITFHSECFCFLLWSSSSLTAMTPSTTYTAAAGSSRGSQSCRTPLSTASRYHDCVYFAQGLHLVRISALALTTSTSSRQLAVLPLQQQHVGCYHHGPDGTVDASHGPRRIATARCTTCTRS